jgi:hypothetical protein
MESEIHRIGDLEISQDLEMQQRIWKMQRIGCAATSGIRAFWPPRSADGIESPPCTGCCA